MTYKDYLEVEFSDGNVYIIPSHIVLASLTDYYVCKVDGIDKRTDEGAEIWTKEYYSTEESDLIDWARNNMNWKDLRKYAKLIKNKKVKVNYNEEWTNAKMIYRNKKRNEDYKNE